MIFLLVALWRSRRNNRGRERVRKSRPGVMTSGPTHHYEDDALAFGFHTDYYGR